MPWDFFCHSYRIFKLEQSVFLVKLTLSTPYHYVYSSIFRGHRLLSAMEIIRDELFDFLRITLDVLAKRHIVESA